MTFPILVEDDVLEFMGNFPEKSGASSKTKSPGFLRIHTRGKTGIKNGPPAPGKNPCIVYISATVTPHFTGLKTRESMFLA